MYCYRITGGAPDFISGWNPVHCGRQRDLGRQGNAMVHNYWSHKHVADRLNWTAEEYGIKVRTVSEAYTGQISPC